MKILTQPSTSCFKNTFPCCHGLKQKLAITFGLAAAVLLLPAKTSAQCLTATKGGSWQDAAMTSQAGTFTATFDATPSATPTNSVIALSNGAQTTYANFACLVRFNPTGDIDARNGGAYAAASTIPYSAGVSYRFRLVVNIAARTYSIYVTPAGGSELTVGLNYAFRISDATLNYWGVFVDSASGGAGSVTVCNFSTGGTLSQVATPSFSPAPGSYSSAQSVSITTSTNGASIRFTTDGSTPTETAGTLYSGPVNIGSTATLKAIAYESGFTDSAVASGTYTISSGTGWTLVWSDEFNGPAGSVPDPTKWIYDVGGGGWGNNELEYYCSPTSSTPCNPGNPNISLDGNGNLVIKAIKDSGGNWTSGRMNTSGKFQVQYGRIEARMKLPVGAGIWPAFWMLGTNIGAVGWPTCGEQDIMEWVPQYGSNVTSSTIHGPGYSGSNGIGSTYTFPNGGAVTDANYHVYGVIWSANKMQFYRDDYTKPFFTVTPSNIPAGTQWVYNQPFFLILNLAIGGNFPGNPDSSTPNPAIVLVDYVRVYQQSSGTGGEGPFGGTPANIPGTVQAENYDTGGQGTAYNVTSINGTDNAYRSDSVDLETTSDTGGGDDLGWTNGGQWFRYTVNVATAGTYAISFRVAAPTAVTGAFHLANSSGTNLSGTVNVPATGGWQNWTTVTANVTLPAGQQVLTLNQDSGGWNVNYLSFASSGGTVSAPTFSPGGGTYANAQSVTITSATSGASIRFTTDGSTPAETAGTLYSGPVNIGSTATLKAIAYESGFTDSNVAVGTYTITTSSEGPFGGSPATIPGTVQAENYDTGGQGLAYNVTSINGTGNSYRSDGVDLESTTDTGGGDDLGWTNGGQWFRYTVNVAAAGTYTVSFRVADPNGVTGAFHLANSSGTNLSGSVSVPATGGWQNWTTVTASVTLPAGQQVLTLNQDSGGWNINYLSFASSGGTVSAPTFSPGGGTYANAQSVTITSATNGASIRYTTDGSTPTETAGTIYSGPVNIGSTATLKAIAYESGFTDSNAASTNYTISAGGSAPATPSGLAASATGTSAISVTWNSSAGATSYDLQVDGSTIMGVASPYTSSGLAAGSTHTYAVRADNSAGDSPFSASVSATTSTTSSGSLTLGLMANPNGRYFSGYYPSWSDNWFTSLNNDGSLKTDNQLYQASNFAQIPGVCTHVMAAFAQPNFAWSGINANSWSGTGLDFTAMPQDIKNIVRILHELNRKVILSVGGATYTNWSGLAAEAGKTGTPIKTALTQFLTDMGFDGLDVDFELTGADPASVAEYAQSIQAMAEAVRAAGSGRILTIAGWSTGADYTAATENDPGFPGVISYWGGNAGRERQTFEAKVASGPFAGQTIASLFSLVNVMSYDAGYQNFDPVTAYNEYRALIPSGASVGVGLEIPTEAWGGATLVLNNSEAGSAGTVVLMDQYNNKPRGSYSVQRFAGVVMANTTNANPHDGVMEWDLLKTTAPTDANATSVAAYVAGLYGYVGVAP
jgi:beta-glucanase (GH16 family)